MYIEPVYEKWLCKEIYFRYKTDSKPISQQKINNTKQQKVLDV